MKLAKHIWCIVDPRTGQFECVEHWGTKNEALEQIREIRSNDPSLQLAAVKYTLA